MRPAGSNQALKPGGNGQVDRDWVEREGKRLSNAGRWGATDDLGAWNLVTPQKVLEATACVRRGQAFSLSLPFGSDGPEGPPGRPQPLHFMSLTGTDLVGAAGQGAIRSPGFADDWLVMNLSASTQWDGFAHVFSAGTSYNDVPAAAISANGGASRLSVSALCDRIVTRGVLLDIPRLLGCDWLQAGFAVTPDLLDQCCLTNRIDVAAGDVVLVRTGALKAVRTSGDWGDYAGRGPQPGLGVLTADWLASRDVAAVATDTWACEVLPYETADTVAPLHQILLSRCGISIGEMFDLEALAEDCHADGVHEFLLVAPPLNITGAVNAPINPLAIK
jgi:kynurenine formamidase